MMNNFEKIYTPKQLGNNKMVTIISLPMEESIMFPVAQAIDLMKQGENILYFSFNHDSSKINEFFNQALRAEAKNAIKELGILVPGGDAEEREISNQMQKITGMNAIVDSHQIPEGVDWLEFAKGMIDQVKKECELNFVFFDIFPFTTQRGETVDSISERIEALTFMKNFTPIMIKAIEIPKIDNLSESAQNNLIEEMANIDFDKMAKSCAALIEQSDFVMGIKREKKTFLKKVLNILLFWRKRNNFTIKTLKSRKGKDSKTFRMNLDMDNFKTEIF